jgi:hypothetical protein
MRLCSTVLEDLVPGRSAGLRTVLAAVCLSAAILIPGEVASAATWVEVSDAGSLVSTAQTTAGSGPLTAISGTLASDSDVDMYCIYVNDPANFRAGLVCSAFQEPHVWLFDASGIGLAHDDGCQAAFTGVGAPYAPVAGTYYLAVGGFGALALNGTSNIWTYSASNPIVGQRPPDGPAAGLPLTGWSGGQVGQFPGPSYTVHLDGAAFCGPEVPTSIELRSWGSIKNSFRRP